MVIIGTLFTALLVFAEISDVVGQSNCSVTNTGRLNGTIESPGYPRSYGPNKFCNYRIGVPLNLQVKLDLNDVQIQDGFDRMVIFGGPDCMSERIGVVLSSTTGSFISASSEITALLITENGNGNWRIKGNYSAVTSSNPTTLPPNPGYFQIYDNCGKELNGITGIMSYVGSELHVLCIWRVTVPPGRRVQLRFSTVAIQSQFTWLRVIDGGTCDGNLLALFDRNTPIIPSNINSTDNMIIVVFSSVLTFSDVVNISYFEIMPQASTATAALTTTMNLTTNVLTSYQIGGVTETEKLQNSPATVSTSDIPYTLLAGLAICLLVITFGRQK